MPIIKTMNVNKSMRTHKKCLAHDYCQCKLIQSLWTRVWRFPQRVKLEFLCDLLPSLLYIYTKDILKAFTSASYAHCIIFTIAKLWNNSKHLSTGVWTRKMWHKHILSAICLCLNRRKDGICTNVCKQWYLHQCTWVCRTLRYSMSHINTT